MKPQARICISGDLQRRRERHTAPIPFGAHVLCKIRINDNRKRRNCLFLRRVGAFGALAHARRIVTHRARALEVCKAVDVDRGSKIGIERNSHGRVGTDVIRRLPKHVLYELRFVGHVPRRRIRLRVVKKYPPQQTNNMPSFPIIVDTNFAENVSVKGNRCGVTFSPPLQIPRNANVRLRLHSSSLAYNFPNVSADLENNV